MSVLTSDVQTDEGAAVRAGREVVPPDLPPGYTELNNQREVNWWMHREVENVGNRTTILETSQRQQDERIYALEQATPEVPDVDGGDWDKDLEAYAKKEYVDLQDDALSERIRVVENDYTTTDEFNLLFTRTKDNAKGIEANAVLISKNAGEIQGLQEGFDAAVIAAQEGADKLEIELQSYVKKDELPEAPPEVNLSEVACPRPASLRELAVWAGQEQVAPEQDRGGRIGWAYRSKGDGTKAHWDLWSQDRTASAPCGSRTYCRLHVLDQRQWQGAAPAAGLHPAQKRRQRCQRHLPQPHQLPRHPLRIGSWSTSRC